MRGFLLSGLALKYGKVIALFVSSMLFAVLHFNMVQTLSALICGIVLGLLYLHTGSIFCCILTHVGYNLISYVTIILPLYGSKYLNCQPGDILEYIPDEIEQTEE